MNSNVPDATKGIQKPLKTCWWLPGETRELLLRMSLTLCMLMTFSSQIIIAGPTDGPLANNTRLTLELNGESLESALKKIEKLTPFRFVYRSEEVNQVENLKL